MTDDDQMEEKQPDEEPQKKPSPRKVAADLLRHYKRLIEDGTGRGSLDQDQEVERRLVIDDAITDVFALYAKVKMAEALGILPWLSAAMTGQFAARPDEDF
jgi:hypothetical protein